MYLVGLGQEQFAGDSRGVSRCHRYLRRFLFAKPSRNGRGVPTCRQKTLTSGGLRHHAFLSPYHFLPTAHLATLILTAFVLFVQEYGRKHVGKLAEGQGEGQGKGQGGLYSIVPE